tara:strand:- start:2221 stop:3021 length:801 start_codon:yes stop_codon:yes gene_type:complete
MKKYFFLSGLPRAGNTLLSSILNQNPDLSVSANSFVCDILYHGATLQFTDFFENFPDYKSLESYLRSIFDSYYKNWDAKYIIDRGPWGTEFNLDILEQLFGDDIKIICMVRDIPEILTSFIRLNPNWIDKRVQDEINSGNRYNNFYKSDIEMKCEILMRPTGQIDKALYSLSNLFRPQNKKYLHLIEYNDLIADTESVINKLYNFLEIPFFNHRYTYIDKFKVNNIEYNDTVFGCDLHSVHPNIVKSNYKVPDEIIEKYSGLEFWK